MAGQHAGEGGLVSRPTAELVLCKRGVLRSVIRSWRSRVLALVFSPAGAGCWRAE
jgi:hypothetical protein